MRQQSHPSAPLKVLIVEDEVLLAMELESQFEMLEQEVIGSASNAAQALALAEQGSPDLALVDVNLSDGRTGPEIASRLANEHEAFVVFMTGTPEQIPDDYAGALGVITKPWDPETIEQLVTFIAALRSVDENSPSPRPPTRMRMAASYRLQ